jgi:hypothetical protein
LIKSFPLPLRFWGLRFDTQNVVKLELLRWWARPPLFQVNRLIQQSY